jgi:hypothetical protein
MLAVAVVVQKLPLLEQAVRVVVVMAVLAQLVQMVRLTEVAVVVVAVKQGLSVELVVQA